MKPLLAQIPHRKPNRPSLLSVAVGRRVAGNERISTWLRTAHCKELSDCLFPSPLQTPASLLFRTRDPSEWQRIDGFGFLMQTKGYTYEILAIATGFVRKRRRGDGESKFRDCENQPGIEHLPAIFFGVDRKPYRICDQSREESWWGESVGHFFGVAGLAQGNEKMCFAHSSGLCTRFDLTKVHEGPGQNC